MRAVVQLVDKGSVSVNKKVKGSIGEGLVVFLGVHKEDSEKDAVYLAEKIIHLRIFQDEKGLMNRSVLNVGGKVLVISQFTLFGDCRKGRRPSYAGAAPPRHAEELYQVFIEEIKKKGVAVVTGEFRAMMEVSLVNKGPVTLLLDSSKTF